MNLTICLLSARRFVTKAELRRSIDGYREAKSFDRMFERDKDELRSNGIEIETGSNDDLFGDNLGYRILPDTYELGTVEFDADEATMIGFAARAWQEASVAEATRSAMAKLQAVGVEVDSERVPGIELTLPTSEPSFVTFYDAVIDRVRVRFDYRTSGATRELEPWGVIMHRGRWYVIGQDVDKDVLRMFRLSRVVGEPQRVGRSGSYDVPAGTNLRELAAALTPPAPDRHAVLAIRAHRAPALRRRGQLVPTEMSLPPGFEMYEVGYASTRDLAGELASAGADVVVFEPAELRDAVIDKLSAWATPAGAAPSAPAVDQEVSA